MSSKVLTCQVSSYQDFEREEHWLKKFKNTIDNDQDISEVLENGGSQAKYALNVHSANSLLYSVTNKKTVSANSIFNDINWDNNERFKKYFFSLCGTYFESDKYKGDAYRIITFLREKNILKDFLKEYLNDKISEELSRKDEKANQYLYANEVIFSALVKKHKIDQRKFINFIVTYPLPLALILFSICVGGSTHCNSISEFFTQPVVIYPVSIALCLLLLGIAGSIWMSYAKNNIPVEKMQQKLNAEQNSQGTASIEDLEAEEQEPSTVLAIRLPPSMEIKDTSVGDALAKDFVSGMNAASVWW